MSAQRKRDNCAICDIPGMRLVLDNHTESTCLYSEVRLLVFL